MTDCRVVDPSSSAGWSRTCDVADLAGGLFGPSDGYIDGHALLRRARRGGPGSRRPSPSRTPSSSAATRRRGTGTGSTTSKGTIDCDVVVNAAGGWAGRVGEILGAPVEILPQRHQALMGRLADPLDYVMPSIMDYVPSSGGFGVYIRDDGPGRFIAGLHAEEVVHDIVDPDEVGRDAPDEYVALVGERLAHRLPGLLDMRLGDVWAGIYPMRPDGRPVVGPHPGRPSVVTVAGAGGSGLQSSPALGQIAAEWIIDGRPMTIPAAVAYTPSD